MKFKRLFSFFLYIFILTAVVAPVVDMEAKTTKTTSSKSGKRKSSTRKKTGSSRKRSSSSRNSSSRTKRSGSSKSRNNNVQPKEVVSNDSLTLLVNAALVEMMPTEVNPGGLRVNLAKPEMQVRRLSVRLNENFTYLPINKELISQMEETVKSVLPDSLANFSVSLNVGSHPLTYYISTIDKLPEEYRKNVPFVVEANPLNRPIKGMEGDIVALWHSHGRYYKNGSWAWQRPFLFQTAEDIYTMSYVLPFLVPMLENAGTYVMLPRERDINTKEVIVDNDQPLDGEILYSQPTYFESNGVKKWKTGEFDGFVYDVSEFHDTENPFENGTYREVETTRSGKASSAGWFADIPEDGDYAVYVGYKTLPNSSEDARYTVNYSGGHKEFIVNQTMGGSTWIYLGTFPLKKGYNADIPIVSLNNITDKGGNTVVTADAIKIGGGIGNIGRSLRRSDVRYFYESENEAIPEIAEQVEDNAESGDEQEDIDDNAGDPDAVTHETDPTAENAMQKSKGPAPKFSTSGLPRYLEGARYWLHWAGMPEYVYSPHHGNDDYKDDYSSRGLWVNYLAGGSRVLPNSKGLNIPVDISFALHTDAGKRADDTFIGTLGIYYTDGGKLYADGTPRINSRIMTDMIMRQVVSDIRQNYEPRWTRRQMWDKPYMEAKTAQVPTTLLELLSHQNFADMQYGLDPSFRFTVCRAIYKAMGRFISERKDREFIVQPLPVNQFAIEREKKGLYKLSWQPTQDPMEPTAMPSKYIILERKEGSMGFVKVGETRETHFDVKVNDNKIRSYYIIAANEGGVSFPSEILSLREAGSQKPILIVNGFTRVSGPKKFLEGSQAGFKADEDFGVPYKYDISFSGYQQEFSRGAGEGFGRSGSNHVATTAGGNTFDYPMIHGKAIAENGYGFVSSSVKAVEEGKIKLSDFSAVDLILGKQKETITGDSKSGKQFQAFPKYLQTQIKNYVDRGGKLLITGQNIVSELFKDTLDYASGMFATETLGIENSIYTPLRSGRLTISGINGNMRNFNVPYSNSLRKDYYIIEGADILSPAIGVNAIPFISFNDTGDTAGLLLKNGKSRQIIMSIPFESITDPQVRKRLMEEFLEWLDL